MKLEKLIEMGGKNWTEKSDISADATDCSAREIIKHRVYFDDDGILEAAGVDGFGQAFYYDMLNNTWAGEICGFEIDKMNEFYGA